MTQQNWISFGFPKNPKKWNRDSVVEIAHQNHDSVGISNMKKKYGVEERALGGKEEREREKEGRKVGGEGWVPIIGGKDERVFWSFQKYDRCQ